MCARIDYRHKILAKTFRTEPTVTESLVWDFVRNKKCLGLKFRRQHVIDNFIVDFFCSSLKLVIEIDGKVHEQQKEYDQLRQELIEKRRYHFIRISNEEIINDPSIVEKRIREYIVNRAQNSIEHSFSE